MTDSSSSRQGGDMTALLMSDREALRSALRLLSKRVGRKLQGQQAVLDFDEDEGELIITLGDLSTGSSASGRWAGRARTGAHHMQSLLSALPEEDPVLLEVSGGRLRLGSFSVDCRWVGNHVRKVPVPLDPTPGKLMRLAGEYTAEEIEAAGLTGPVEAARGRFAEAIQKVEEVLKPFGVASSKIVRWVYEAVREGTEQELQWRSDELRALKKSAMRSHRCAMCGTRWQVESAYLCLRCGSLYGSCCVKDFEETETGMTVQMAESSTPVRYSCGCGGWIV